MSENDRKCFRVSPDELRRRARLLDETMHQHALDAVLVQGACSAVGLGGHFMWLTGISPFGSYPQTAIYWRDAPMTIIRHGAFGQALEADPEHPDSFGIAAIRGTPTFPAAHYTLAYDAEIAAREITQRRATKIGLISPGTLFHGFAETLHKELAGCTFIDITEEMDLHKAVKSPYEIGLLRDAAAMQDAILRGIGEHIQPGMRDYDVMAQANVIGERNGAGGTGIFLGSSFRPGDLDVPVKYRGEQGRVVREGDLFFLLVENAAANGMYTHVSRFYSLGKPPQELVDLLGTAVEAQTYTCDLLVPGADPAEVFKSYNAYMEKRGFSPETRLHAHGQGLDLVERPLIRSDERMKMAEGMNIGVDPFLRTSSAIATICDNFLVTGAGLERLHAFPQHVVEVP